MKNLFLSKVIFILLILGAIKPCFAVVIPNTGVSKDKSNIENIEDRIGTIDKKLKHLEIEDRRFLETLKIKMQDQNIRQEAIFKEIEKHEEQNINELQSVRSDLNSIQVKEADAGVWNVIYSIIFVVVCVFVGMIAIKNIRDSN